MRIIKRMRTPLLFLALPVAATLLGGLLAIRFRRFRPVLVAVGAGLLLGAAFLDLLPEAVTLGTQNGLSVADVLGLTLLFFLLFTALEASIAHLSHGHHNPRRFGRIGGALLIFHSFRDGMAIGAAFAASHAAGYAVAIGIAAHDFGDGMNTVLLTTAAASAGTLSVNARNSGLSGARRAVGSETATAAPRRIRSRSICAIFGRVVGAGGSCRAHKLLAATPEAASPPTNPRRVVIIGPRMAAYHGSPTPYRRCVSSRECVRRSCFSPCP